MDRGAAASPEGHERTAKTFVRRIERLATDLVTFDFKRPGNTLWNFQIRLFDLQAEIQQAITRVKNLPRQDPARYEALEDLRGVRWHARRLGDAFAWVLFGGDRRSLHALAGSIGVPVAPERGPRDAAMMTTANQLAKAGWGFPLLHDVTDCLRIGDVTFIKIDPETGTRKLTTVEMKTRLVSQQPAGDNQTRYHFEVSAITGLTNEQVTELGLLDFDETAAALGDDRHAQAPRTRRPDRRLQSQLRRLGRAVDHTSAPFNEIVEIPGDGPFMAAHFISEAKSHWKILRRIIRNARKEGYASEAVDTTFLYAAIYSETGIEEEDIKNDRMIEDLGSDIFVHDGRRKQLLINQIPVVETQSVQDFMPFYLFRIPRRALRDLINGRLVLLVLLNPGKIVEALEADGFQVIDRTGRGDLSPESFILRATLSGPDGKQYAFEYRGMRSHLDEMIYEFKSIQYLVDVARQARDLAQEKMIERVSAST
jgi:hypothetical protein